MSTDDEDEFHEGAAQGSKAAPSPIALLLPAVRRYHLLILLVAVLGVLAGLFRAATTPNQYRSVGKLLVRTGIRENLTVESAISGRSAFEGLRMVSDREALQNELQVLRVQKLFDKVVRRMGAETLLKPYDPTWGASDGGSWSTRLFHGFQSWWFGSGATALDAGFSRDYAAAQMLAQSVQIAPEIGTTVIQIVHHADSPTMAKRVVDEILAAAKELHAEVFSASAQLASVGGELTVAENEARTAEAKLREFCLQREIYAYDSQRELIIGQLDALGQQCDAADLEITRRSAERAELARILEAVPEPRPAPGQVANPEYARLTALIGTLEVELFQLNLKKAQGINDKYADQHKVVTDLLAKTKMDREQEDPMFEPPLVEPPRRERIVQALDEADVALDGLRKQRAQLGLALEATKKRLASFDGYLPELRQLELVARQKREYSDSLAKGVANLRTVQRLDQLDLSNLLVTQEGTLEPVKVAPQRGKLLVVGGLGGLFGGLLVAFGLVCRDRRVRGPFDLRRSGVAAELVDESAPPTAGWPFAEGRKDVAGFWSRVPYDRRGAESMRVAVVPTDGGADAARVAADLAMGLARHGGEKVVLVSCVAGPTSFETAAGLPQAPGWIDVLAGQLSLAAAVQSTPVPGLSYLPAGESGDGRGHAVAQRGLLELLDRLAAQHRFVVLHVADLERQPEVLGLLRVADGAMVVASLDQSERARLAHTVEVVEGSGCRLLAGVLQTAE